ncbi:MAG: hypothetical protein BWY10_00979 [Chloroflexi bacterium ADurb.Bin180]|mgnify:CR=1 FL=1|nr:MAG: hypothetical protein BWY10_00979 [Chloroflexi bacterium ADurb.Bin180]
MCFGHSQLWVNTKTIGGRAKTARRALGRSADTLFHSVLGVECAHLTECAATLQ